MDVVPRVQLSWKRPSNVPFPSVWHTFEVRSKDGQTRRFRIQEIPEDRFDEVIEFMETYFDVDEPLNRFTKILEDEESMLAKRYIIRKILEQKISVMVIPDEDSSQLTLIACYLLFADLKCDQPSIKGKGKTYTHGWSILDALTKNTNPFQIFNSDRFLNEFGICVAPEYRGLGIAGRIFSILPKIANTYRLPGYAAIFSSSYAQAIAKKMGFKLFNELAFEDYKDEQGRVVFPIENPKSLLYMGIKYDPESPS